jgi:hypothetical protein
MQYAVTGAESDVLTNRSLITSTQLNIKSTSDAVAGPDPIYIVIRLPSVLLLVLRLFLLVSKLMLHLLRVVYLILALMLPVVSMVLQFPKHAVNVPNLHVTCCLYDITSRRCTVTRSHPIITCHVSNVTTAVL